MNNFLSLISSGYMVVEMFNLVFYGLTNREYPYSLDIS